MSAVCPAPDEMSCKEFENFFQPVSLKEIEAALNTWRSMVDRCSNPGNTAYPHYGGRGISVCKRWRAFPAFLYDMGPRPEGFTIDRKDNNGNYEPDNCRWATPLEQGCNKRNNRYIEIDGKRVTQSEVARIAGVSDATIMRRMERGYTPQEVISGARVKKIKLCSEDVENIRKLAGAGFSDRALSIRFGVSRQMIGNVRRGDAWQP